ncbi:Uncharacterised protein [Yersinia similis]|uniref:Uncharacterized protein n=2 Tax=Yersinia similis TaxID=367190 RepID=A0A0T9P5W8_9GAMM|nr:Uncharacterised protein [Yersinia similis]
MQKGLQLEAQLKASRMVVVLYEEEMVKLEAELSAANEKLSKPVVLAEGSGWASDPYNNGRNAGIRECKFALKADGFAVEGE